MDDGSFSKLLALAVSLAVALATLWLITRPERSRLPRALVAGYPAREFPRQERLAGPLGELCAGQSSLLIVYASLPPTHPARPGLLVFLEELRALMDGAYDLAALSASPAARTRLERLVHDARGAIREMAETTERQLSDASVPSLDGELELRIDVMRAIARDVY